MGGLLECIRVLDLTNVLAGPFGAYQLALLGAEVIKVEAPGAGDLARQLGADPALNKALMGASFLAQNAGKRSVTINLKSAAGKDVFRRLVRTADVVIENFRPGVMERLGLGYDALRVLQPGLVYCAISGFGQDGPLRDNPAYDQIVQGLSGVMSVTGDAASAPLRVGYPVADTIGGLTAAFAIASALVGAPARGGRVIDVSMLEATLVTMGWQVSNWLIAGVRPALGNENMTAAPSGLFATGGGPRIAANQQRRFETLAPGQPPRPRRRPRFADRETASATASPSGRDRDGAGIEIREGMVRAVQCPGSAGRRGARHSRGAGAPAGDRARPGEDFRGRPRRGKARRRGPQRFRLKRRPRPGDAAAGARRGCGRRAGGAGVYGGGDCGAAAGRRFEACESASGYWLAVAAGHEDRRQMQRKRRTSSDWAVSGERPRNAAKSLTFARSHVGFSARTADRHVFGHAPTQQLIACSVMGISCLE